MSQDTTNTCKITGCDKPVHSRGLCHTHYKMLLRMVQAGETTWQDLEEKGICDKASRTVNPQDRELLQQFIASKL